MQSIEELTQREKSNKEEIEAIKKEIKKSKLRPLLISELVLLPVLFSLFVFSGLESESLNLPNEESKLLTSHYFVENLKGDSIDTWKSWRLIGTTMNVNILAPDNISPEKIQTVTDTITSIKKIEVKDSIIQKSSKILSSTYYLGWKGALNSIENRGDFIKYQLPLEFNIIKSEDLEGDVIITLSTLKDPSGYTGFTKSVVDGNEILKSYITIFDTQNLTEEDLATITRHEFGHALGLGHSTAREDLMAPMIDMTNPYISDCNIDAITDLYNGNHSGTTICEK